MLLLDWLPIEFRGRLRDWLSHSHNKWRYNLQNFFLSFVVYKSPPLIMMNSSIWFWWNEPNLYTLLICTSPNKLVHSLKTSIYRASKSLISKELNWIKHNSCYQGYWPRAFITDHRLYHISHIFQLICRVITFLIGTRTNAAAGARPVALSSLRSLLKNIWFSFLLQGTGKSLLDDY